MSDDLWERIRQLRQAVKNDDLMSGVPRYEHRYSEETRAAVFLLGAGLDQLAGGRACWCGRRFVELRSSTGQRGVWDNAGWYCSDDHAKKGAPKDAP